MPLQGLFFVYAAHFLRPLCGGLACHRRSPRAEHLLIYRIPSHTNPKRRDFSLKQPGQKSAKEEGPEQRKGPKRAVNGSLKVQTHVWEQDAAGSSPVTSTKRNGMQSICMPFFIACTIFHQASNLLLIAPRAEAAPKGCVLRVLSPRPRRCGCRIARSDFFKVTSHSLCHSSSSSTTRCAELALDS